VCAGGGGEVGCLGSGRFRHGCQEIFFAYPLWNGGGGGDGSEAKKEKNRKGPGRMAQTPRDGQLSGSISPL